MTLDYALKLGLKVHFTNVGMEKIDNSILKMFGMVLANFQIKEKLEKPWFFQKTFLLTDLNIKIVLRIPFLTFSNVNIKFA